MKRHLARQLLALAILVLASRSLEAALRPHALFSHNAVLQREEKVPVWGTTDRAEKVTVALAGQEVATLPKDGHWRVELPPLAAGGPHVLSIRQGDETIELANVMVGEVWLCAGQSNMRWAVKQSDGAGEAIAHSANDQLRLLTVPRPNPEATEAELEASWSMADPCTVPDFSAVAYYFGRQLQQDLGVCVGLIAAHEGGTTAEQWTSTAALDAVPELKEMSKPQGAGTLASQMIAPLAPYALRGAIWYQGESNIERAFQYRTLLATLIKNWREMFAQGDFPFLIVQMPGYEAPVAGPSDSAWAELRESQRLAAGSVSNAALIVSADLGDPRDIHPRRKQPVGERLAVAARAVAYLDEKVEPSGPLYDRMSVADGRITLHFKHVGRGLVARDGELEGFTIAGEDQKFHAATATIQGDKVVVSSPQVPKPIAVRYAWAAFPPTSLWNRDGLPASPFRTDTFPLTTQEKK